MYSKTLRTILCICVSKWQSILSKGSFQKLSAKNIWNFPYVGRLEIFLSIFGLLRGKNENVLDLPKNHFKDVKKSCRFCICQGGGSTNIWKIPYVFCRSFLKDSITQFKFSLFCLALVLVLILDAGVGRLWYQALVCLISSIQFLIQSS